MICADDAIIVDTGGETRQWRQRAAWLRNTGIMCHYRHTSGKGPARGTNAASQRSERRRSIVMKSCLSTAIAALMIAGPASAVAQDYRSEGTAPGGTSSNFSEHSAKPPAGSAYRPDAGTSVPGRSYRDQAPPRYRIEPRDGGGRGAFPSVPGTGYRDYSRPSYNTRQ